MSQVKFRHLRNYKLSKVAVVLSFFAASCVSQKEFDQQMGAWHQKNVDRAKEHFETVAPLVTEDHLAECRRRNGSSFADAKYELMSPLRLNPTLTCVMSMGATPSYFESSWGDKRMTIVSADTGVRAKSGELVPSPPQQFFWCMIIKDGERVFVDRYGYQMRIDPVQQKTCGATVARTKSIFESLGNAIVGPTKK
jgi:hypothetical protein